MVQNFLGALQSEAGNGDIAAGASGGFNDFRQVIADFQGLRVLAVAVG